jgi:hypothetical protein
MLFWLVLPIPAADASVSAEPQWDQIRGVNFFTSTAMDATDMWRHFDPELADRELGWMQQLGFNGARIWLSEIAWHENPGPFTRNLNNMLDLAEKHKMYVLLVLFDCGGVEARADSVEMSLGDAYQYFLRQPSLSDEDKKTIRSRYATFAEGGGKLMYVPIGKDSPYDVMFWQHWTPNPGFRHLGTENWPGFETYIDAVVKTTTGRKGSIVIDLMNEPSTLMDLPAGVKYADAKAQVVAFVARTAAYFQNRYPTVIRTIGSSSMEDMESLAQYQTVLSIHSYVLGDALVKVLKTASEFAAQQHKGLLLTECLANTDDWLKSYGEESLSTDEGQLRHYERTLPIILKSGIGFYAFAGFVGRMFTPTTDIIHPNGYMRPAAAYLQRELAAAKSHQSQ